MMRDKGWWVALNPDGEPKAAAHSWDGAVAAAEKMKQKGWEQLRAEGWLMRPMLVTVRQP